MNDRLAALAGWGLPGGGELISPPADMATRLIVEARTGGLGGVLLAAADAGALSLPDHEVADLARHHRRDLVRCLGLEQRLLAVTSTLADAGLDAVVLKGPAVAHLDLVDPSLRIWSDIDLLVRNDQLGEIVDLLTGTGLSRPIAEQRPGFDRRFGKGVALLGDDGIEVDLHCSFAEGVFGARMVAADVFARHTELRIGGRRLAAPCLTHRFLHSCYHATVGSLRPKAANLREIATYLSTGGLDRSDAVATASRWGGLAVLAAAVELTRASVAFEAPEWFEWADHVEIPAGDRRLVGHLGEGVAGLARHKLALVSELPDRRSQGAYLWALAVPSSAHLRSKGLTRLHRLERWMPGRGDVYAG